MTRLELMLDLQEGVKFQIDDAEGCWTFSNGKISNEKGEDIPVELLIKIIENPYLCKKDTECVSVRMISQISASVGCIIIAAGIAIFPFKFLCISAMSSFGFDMTDWLFTFTCFVSCFAVGVFSERIYRILRYHEKYTP